MRKHSLRAVGIATMVWGVVAFAEATNHTPMTGRTENCDSARNRELIEAVAEQKTRIAALERERSHLEEERRRLAGIIERIRIDVGGIEYRPTGSR